VPIGIRVLQIQKTPWREPLVGCRVVATEHLDGALSVGRGSHTVGRFNAEGMPLQEIIGRRRKAVEKPLRGNPKTAFPPSLQIPQRSRDSHFPTAKAVGLEYALEKRTHHAPQKPDIVTC
jgi:hypothetical protein